MSDITEKKFGWLASTFLFLFAVVYLGVCHYEYLYKVQNCTLFLANEVFYNDIMQHSSGMLRYVSRYLAQFLIYPWLGAVVAGVGYVAIAKLTSVLRGGLVKWECVGLLLPLVILYIQTSFGYALYTKFESAYFFELELGFILAMLLALAGKAAGGRFGIKGLAVVMLLGLLSCYAIGIFGLLGAILSVCALWRTKLADLKATSMVSLVGTNVLVYAAIAYCVSVQLNEEFAKAFFSPLPDSVLGRLFYVSVFSLLLAVAVILFPKTDEKKKLLTANMGLVLALLALFTTNDSNFNTEIKLQHLAESQKWHEIIDETNKIEQPTAPIANYRFIALHHSDRLWNEVFDYPARFDTIKCPYENITDMVYVHDLYFYCSVPNKAYRWEMEKWVNVGRDFELLKQFVMYALYRDEPRLATRYIDLLKQTTFYKGWAEDKEKYLGNRTLLLNDYPSYKTIDKYEVNENVYTVNCNLQMVYAKYKHPNIDQMRFRLLLDLYNKNLEQFVADWGYASHKFGMPKNSLIEEALTLAAMQTRNPALLQQYGVSQEIVKQTQNFLRDFQNYKDHLDEGAEAMSAYKGTLCYYLLYSNLYEYLDKKK